MIRIPEIRVILEDGTQKGILPIKEALKLAEEMELDLVEVSPNAKPPVCRIMNYGKFRYEQRKKAKDAKKKQHRIQLKEIQLRPKIDEHDFQTKLRFIQNFLDEGNKVKVTLSFKGREMAHQDRGVTLIEKLLASVSEMADIEQEVKLIGKNLVTILVPKLKKKKPAVKELSDTNE